MLKIVCVKSSFRKLKPPAGKLVPASRCYIVMNCNLHHLDALVIEDKFYDLLRSKVLWICSLKPSAGEDEHDCGPMRNDFKCLANSLDFSMFTACPAFLMTTIWALSPICLLQRDVHIYLCLRWCLSSNCKQQHEQELPLGWNLTFSICGLIPEGISDLALPIRLEWAAPLKTHIVVNIQIIKIQKKVKHIMYLLGIFFPLSKDN